MPGRTILQYEILERLGQGGMGLVYKAVDTRLKRSVALKFLPTRGSSRAADREQLKSEARLAAALNHPNVATVYAIEESGDDLFLSMEYVPGLTLREILAENGARGIPLERKLDYARQIAHGLSAAHHAGIIHRDIKCGNIMVTPEGRVKILDFGVALPLGDTGERPGGTASGTAASMSPEQVRGDELDVRTDVWSFGVVLYELFGGAPPFTGKYEQAVIFSLLHEKPKPLRRLDEEVPEEVAAIVERALEKDRARRFQSVDEMLERLEAVPTAGARPGAAAASGRLFPRFPRRPALLIPLVLLLVATLVWLARRTQPEGAGSGQPAIAVLPFSTIGPGAEDNRLGDGITESIITDLSRYRGVSVIARRSSMQMREHRGTLEEIAKALDVRFIVDGSVQKEGERIRVYARLMDASNGRDLWADRFDRGSGDLFALQDTLAGAIARALSLSTAPGLPGARESPATSLDAYDAYLRGLSYASRIDRTFRGSSDPSDEMAIGMFERAVALDPRFAAARAALANSYITRLFARDPSPELLEKAERQVDTALALAPSLGEAHLARGNVLWTRPKGFPHAAAIRELRRALELSPSLAEAHFLLGTVYLHVGLLEEGLAEYRKAARLDPENVSVMNRVPGIILYQHKYRDVLEEFERNPQIGGEVLWIKAMALLHLGRTAEARALTDSLTALYPRNPDVAATQAVVLAHRGEKAGAEARIADAVAFGREMFHFHHAAYKIACAYALMGEKEKALEWLRAAAKDGMPSYPLYAGEPFFRSLSADPDFVKFLNELRGQYQSYRPLAAPSDGGDDGNE